MRSKRFMGISLVLIGAVLWGVSGTVAQYLFQEQNFSPEWLTVVRLLLAGVILLTFGYRKEKQRIWAIWKSKHDRSSLVLFGLLGMLAVQYTYFAAIQHGNAATATVLQYLGPVLITCYAAVRAKRLPTRSELLAVVLAIAGTFLLVTHGSLSSLSVSGWALFWGISSAFALAFYTLNPQALLDKWGSTIIVGWGMLVGGVGFSFVHPPWAFTGHWSVASLLAFLFIIIFGTVIAFYCYLESLQYLTASETSLIACIEPLSAAVLSVVWLNVSFGLADWLGTLGIVGTLIVLSLGKSRKRMEKNTTVPL
ncbi:EamA family transporter [Brevibacillus fluminis]|uniref:EamA family transporter n=1 Tax=Brevibacillus fluminis TaxID=511487 RepID=A0A3M8DTU7_9BACL|nr:EamA family transporter [Brevibacillus fluminis]RNB91613.1 EamA family transporter [Brevibacillus fluminis]